jgi:hypothetical protein
MRKRLVQFNKKVSFSYEMSSDSFSWHDFDEKNRHTVRCDETANNQNGLYIELVVSAEEIRAEKGKSNIVNVYTVHLFPPLQLRNLLPVDIHVTSPINAVIGGGEGIPLNVIAGHEVKFWIDYGSEYEATLKLKYNPDDLEIVTLCDKASPTSELNLGVHWGLEYLHKECSIYAPYWIVNNTGKTLSYLVSL